MWTLTTANGPFGSREKTTHATKAEALKALDALCLECDIDDCGDEVFAYSHYGRGLCATIGDDDDDSIMGLAAGLLAMCKKAGVK
jgi:hypothetical protein